VIEKPLPPSRVHYPPPLLKYRQINRLKPNRKLLKHP
jgi:hypothetical protein